jgi:hypothetical protein
MLRHAVTQFPRVLSWMLQVPVRVRSRPRGAAAAWRDKAGNWKRWYRENIPLAEQLYLQYTTEEQE